MLGLQPGLVHQVGDESALPQPIAAPFFTVDDFLPRGEAQRLRGEIEAHFAEPQEHTPERHQVWNYWYVPQLYTYLRTSPEKVIAASLVRRFYETLSVFAREIVGLGYVTWPHLSLYVDGCEQQLHNDSANGRLGYVYSLTRDTRKTIGGETILLKEGDGFRSNLERPAAGWGLYDLIEPSFNRLALFDDRMPHGVRRVDGSMDPLEGRFVLHGHISESGPFAAGPISAAAIDETVAAALAPLHAELEAGAAAPHGPLTLRLTIAASGRIEQLQTMLNRVVRADGGSVDAVVEGALAIVSGLRWPRGTSATQAVVPILFGGSLPWMRASEA
jgi:Rps23 Pro-64 3,4-dihydroxylase Tpa1-like proline 4-hydroxylase